MGKTLTAREAYNDCIKLFDDTIKPVINRGLSRLSRETKEGFSGKIEPQGGFEITLTVTHEALTILAKRYRPANFEFHEQRELLPGASERDRKREPLRAIYTKVTIDFSPYGTRAGGGSNDNGGNSTKLGGDTQQSTTESGIPSPSGPSQPQSPGTSSTSLAVA